jgi:hypothetical protein
MTGGEMQSVSPLFLEAMEIAMGTSDAAPTVEHLEALTDELVRLNVRTEELEFQHAQFEALEDQNASLRVENRRARAKLESARLAQAKAENIMCYAGLERAARAGWFGRALGALGRRL